MKLSTLAALCAALDCAPADLLVLEATAPAVVPVPRETAVRPAVTVVTATRTRSLPPI
ncbi:helix-turn-helix domain-containing protein [Streptomyces sp. NPDC054854]